MRRADIVSAAVLFALGLVAILVVIPRNVADGALSGELPPSFMPYVAATIGTVAMALLLCVRLVRRGPDDAPAPLPRDSWIFIGAATAVLGAAFAVMTAVGYVAAATIVVAGFMALARAPWKAAVAAALALPAGLWFLFDRVLGFPLP